MERIQWTHNAAPPSNRVPVKDAAADLIFHTLDNGDFEVLDFLWAPK